MLDFKTTNSGVILEYTSDFGSDNEWAWRELEQQKRSRISRAFVFIPSDLTNPPDGSQDFQDYVYEFQLGTFEDGYVRIPGRILAIDQDVLISNEMKLKRSIFVAERNVSIFGRISDLMEGDTPIVIGGMRPGAIPQTVFEELLRKFPNSYEMDRYAEARVHTILSQYLNGMKDARGHYESYLNKKTVLSAQDHAPLNLEVVKRLEVDKYTLIRDSIKDALKNGANWSELEWQKQMASFLLLLFPKYVKVLQSVRIPDSYTTPGKTRRRIIDLCLVDASGHVDVIELKKPFDNAIFRGGLYRENHIPTAELSGGIMQVEKYLFHLSKWGIKGEAELTKKYAHHLPPGMSIRISNPKAILIVGRDEINGTKMADGQLLDFEILRRKYANMIDIVTYDDLLRRLENVIYALEH